MTLFQTIWPILGRPGGNSSHRSLVIQFNDGFSLLTIKFTLSSSTVFPASEAAYAGVVYLRIFYSDTTISTTIVAAKSKVTPVKTRSILKLELCAAMLLSSLMSSVRVDLNIEVSNIFAWSDSTIVLGWLTNSPHRLNTHVANRVVAATEAVPPNHWRHVPTTDNRADFDSRG